MTDVTHTIANGQTVAKDTVTNKPKIIVTVSENSTGNTHTLVGTKNELHEYLRKMMQLIYG